MDDYQPMKDVELESDFSTTEADRVVCWRLQILLDAGYPAELADPIATSDVDLHEASELVARGCAPELAARILL